MLWKYCAVQDRFILKQYSFHRFKRVVFGFSKNVEKIYDSFKEENPTNNQLILVHKRKDNEDGKEFNYIEVLLNKDGNFFNIITSAFSSNGDFLKTKVEEKKN